VSITEVVLPLVCAWRRLNDLTTLPAMMVVNMGETPAGAAGPERTPAAAVVGYRADGADRLALSPNLLYHGGNCRTS
jgi:hypothetical protein